MGLSVTSRSLRTNRTTNVLDFLVLHSNVLKRVADTGLNERPRALVLVFFLAPDPLSIRVELHLLDKREEGEWS